MMLSAKARRYVDDAIASVPDPRVHARWRSVGEEFDVEAAEVALAALQYRHQQLSKRLRRAELSEDEQADLANDLSFIQVVENHLRQESLLQR